MNIPRRKPASIRKPKGALGAQQTLAKMRAKRVYGGVPVPMRRGGKR